MTVYCNDGFYDEADVPYAGLPHFRYGAGFFETILCDRGELCRLDRHLDRILSSCRDFGYRTYSFDYKGVAARVVEENGLSGSTARVNICHLAQSADQYSVFIAAAHYTPPPADKVVRLCTYPHVHDSYMNRYKSLSYMHFHMAKKYAADRGFDDAVLTDGSGNVLETASSALVVRRGDVYYAPLSENRLMSISLDVFRDENRVEQADTHVSETDYDGLLVMNSLMGVRKAIWTK